MTMATSRIALSIQYTEASRSAQKRQSEARRRRIVQSLLLRGSELSRSTIRHMVSSVGLFENWLWETYDDEKRNIEEIPPEELDVFLQKFFATIKKPDGGKYTPDSFRMLRSKLDIYLRSQGYPCSIITSDPFYPSQQVFKQAKLKLIIESPIPPPNPPVQYNTPPNPPIQNNNPPPDPPVKDLQ